MHSLIVSRFEYRRTTRRQRPDSGMLFLVESGFRWTWLQVFMAVSSNQDLGFETSVGTHTPTNDVALWFDDIQVSLYGLIAWPRSDGRQLTGQPRRFVPSSGDQHIPQTGWHPRPDHRAVYRCSTTMLPVGLSFRR